ncbi:MAG: ATP-binding protein [Magnetococcales bacterium]|nr:ATP-binding protein [Magnetococcales bacterium]
MAVNASVEQEFCCEQHGAWKGRLLPHPFQKGETLAPMCPDCIAIAERNRQEEEQLQKGRERQSLIEKKIGQAGIERRFLGKTFSNFLAVNEDQAKALKVAKRYATTLDDRIDQGDCLVFCGRPGTGKSHLASSIIQLAINEGKTAAYLSVYDLILTARSTYGNRNGPTLKEELQALIDVDLLALDEVGVKSGSEDGWLIASLIDARYRKKKPSIVISNLSPDALEEYLGERIMDRLRDGKGVVVAFCWESHRRQKQPSTNKVAA